MFKKLKSQNTPLFEVITFSVQINITIDTKKSIMRCTAVWEIHNINTKRKFNRLVFKYNQNIKCLKIKYKKMILSKF